METVAIIDKAIIGLLLVTYPCAQQKLRLMGGDYWLFIMSMNQCKVCLYMYKVK